MKKKMYVKPELKCYAIKSNSILYTSGGESSVGGSGSGSGNSGSIMGGGASKSNIWGDDSSEE